jgi:hypothetical protein
LSATEFKLVDARKSKFVFGQKQEYCDWFWHFGIRFGCLSLLQVAFGFDCLSPFCFVVDERTANVQFRSVNESKNMPEFMFPRVCGRLGEFVDPAMLNGPVKTGIMSSSNCLSWWRRRVNFHLKSVLGEELGLGEKVSRFCLLGRQAEDIGAEIEELMTRASQNVSLFTVPWI